MLSEPYFGASTTKRDLTKTYTVYAIYFAGVLFSRVGCCPRI